MVISSDSLKDCIKWLKSLTPPELHDNIILMYEFMDTSELNTEERHKMNKIWLNYLHGTKNEGRQI